METAKQSWGESGKNIKVVTEESGKERVNMEVVRVFAYWSHGPWRFVCMQKSPLRWAVCAPPKPDQGDLKADD